MPANLLHRQDVAHLDTPDWVQHDERASHYRQVIDPIRRAGIHPSIRLTVRCAVAPALRPTGSGNFSSLNTHAGAGTSTGTVDSSPQKVLVRNS